MNKAIVSTTVSILLVVTSGCATVHQIDEGWKDQYIGKTGYFLRHATVHPYYKGKSLDNCKPVTIKDLVWVNLAVGTSGIGIKVDQAGTEKIVVQLSQPVGTNGNIVSIPRNLAESGKLLDSKFWSPKLPWKNVPLKVKDSHFTERQALCSGTYWTGMTWDQFLFAMPSPERINTTVYGGLKQEQWVYQKPGGEDFEKIYFYFSDGVLKSWQN